MAAFRATWNPNLSAPRVAQVATLLVSSNTNTHTFIVSLANPEGSTGVTVTILTTTADGVLTTDQLASAIQVAFAASKNEFARQITATVATSTVTFTANVPGVPFVISKSGTGTSTLTTTQANIGPNDLSVAGNFTEGAALAADADFYVSSAVPILYGKNQSGFTIDQFIVEAVACPMGNPGAPLKLIPTRMEFSGLAPAYIDIGNAAISPRIRQTAYVQNGCGLYLTGSAMVDVIVERGAVVGIAMQSGDTANLTGTLINDGGRVYTGADTTCPNYQQIDGYGRLEHGALTLGVVDAGDLDFLTTGSCAQLINNGAYINASNRNAIVILDGYAGTTDLSRCKFTRTVGGTRVHDHAVHNLIMPTDSLTTVSNYTGFGKKTRSAKGDKGGGSGFGN